MTAQRLGKHREIYILYLGGRLNSTLLSLWTEPRDTSRSIDRAGQFDQNNSRNYETQNALRYPRLPVAWSSYLTRT